MADARTKRLTIVACILGTSVVFLDGTVVNVALPAIRDDLGGGLAAQQWVVEAYLLTLGSLLLVGGSLGDLLGRASGSSRSGWRASASTSLLCAVAPSAEVLIAMRALQGVAGALLVPSSLAVITAVFPADERGAAIGTWTAWAGIAMVLGPFGGGLLVDHASWRWIFAINVPFVLATLVILRTAVPESRDEESTRRIDYLGAVLVALGLAGPVFALIEQPVYGMGDPVVWVPFVLGLALLAAFVWHEGRTDHPMLPLRAVPLAQLRGRQRRDAARLRRVRRRRRSSSRSSSSRWRATARSRAGLTLLPITAVMFTLSRRWGALSDRIGPRLLMGGGPIVAGLGLIWMGQLERARRTTSTELLPAVLVFALGLSMTVAPLTNTVLGSVPQHHAGVASGANNAISRVAGLLAIAAVGAIVSAQFGSALDGELAGRPLTPGSARGGARGQGPPADRRRARAAGARPRRSSRRSVHAYRVGLGVGGGL